MSTKPKLKPTIDVSDWEVEGWSAELLAAGFPSIETAVKKIAREAIEAFFEGDLIVEVGPHGIAITDDGGGVDPTIVIPWRGRVLFDADSTLPALRKIIALCQDACENHGVAFPPPAEMTEEEWNEIR